METTKEVTQDEVAYRTVVEPLFDLMLVRPIAEEKEKMVGSLYVPDTAKDPPAMGEVLAVGPGQINEQGEHRPLCVSVGAVVLYGKYSGSEVVIDGEELLMLRELDVLGRVYETEITDADFRV